MIVGLILIGGGLYWRIYDDVFTLYIKQYVYDTTDPYYLANDLFWHAIPFLLMIGGVVMLIMAGFSRGGTKVVTE